MSLGEGGRSAEADTVLGGCLARNVTSGTDVNKLRGGPRHLGRKQVGLRQWVWE